MNLRKMLAEINSAVRHGELGTHEPVKWRCEYRVEKRESGVYIAGETPYEVIDGVGNLLMTAGATALWNGLVTAGLATPFNSTNAQLAVGNSTTAVAAGDTDLNAAAGATLAISGATNAAPIVITNAASSFVVGQVVVVAGVVGNTNANGTWEISAVTSTTTTLLNSTGNAAYTSGGTIALINKYRSTVKQAPTVTTNQVQFVSDFLGANANFQWNEFGVSTGGAATNKQATPPPTLLNHAVPGTNLGTKTSGTWTLTVTLSLS